ncbi:MULTISPECIES: hypothetical protein [Chryseobacterium]|uniref:Uncharacterized protein n=1 Tax=Chryseobacterium caseinilyticum TaxID=2771428 RepID=A0ABR8ZCG1_9FLAO|nr:MULTISPECIES: hypothetical protein [Chryseobacterium]KQS89989.1 hypothetical protein ASG21_13535 [Chryseobacterium sp. Leaf394]MBD8082999.1 hypothetical protein [Chryseobacterium caseinilyticum]
MDQQVRKLKKLIANYLHKSKNEILISFGRPARKSDSEVWFFRKFKPSFYNDEIVFIFEDDKVVDISISKYFLWKELINVYYFEGKNPEFKVVSFLAPKDL